MAGYGNPPEGVKFDGSTPGPGRPPGSVNMRTLLREMLSDGRLGEAGDLWHAQWLKAKDGDTPAAKFIIDNLEGLLTQKVETVVKDPEIIVHFRDSIASRYGDKVASEILDEVESKVK